FPGVFLHGLFFARRVADDLVIHVGNIHGVLEFEADLQQKPAQDVDGHKGAEVADMPVIVDRGAAVIHTHRVVPSRREFFHLAGQRVVEAQRQTVIVAKGGAANGAAMELYPFSSSGLAIRGRLRRRMPVALKIAPATAGARPIRGVSPAPAGGTSLRSINSTSILGRSRKRGTR